ncbi:MAG: Na/Pi cotransporter family protein [Acetobacteraceae bacterium]|nr:Na/Pi cotransporter family protein [Acetobacteraceae bacterium]
MLFPWALLKLAGSVALLLWGVHMVQTGVQRAFGARLRALLGTALRSRGRAFLAGIGVTAILQSSTATGLMVTGFAAGGLVDLVPALAVMLGANVGTTLIVQVLSFDVAEIAPVLILVGVLMFRRASAGPRDFGRVLIGLGLLLMALRQFVDLLTPFEDAPSLRMLLGSVADQPVLDVVLAAGLTWAAHSSVAIVLVVMSFAAKGTVPPDAAFALVLGANLGTAINPLLEGGTKQSEARRLPLGNLLNRIVGVSAALILLHPIGRWMVAIEPDPARAVADFHSGFNVIMAAICFPLLTPFARLLRRWLPVRVDAADPGTPMYLDPAAHETPVVALGGAAREALRLADVLEAMLHGFGDALERSDRRRAEETKRLDDVLDRLDTAIKAYLSELDPEAMSEADHDRAREILAFALNMEAAGDVVDKNLLASVSKQIRRGLALSREARAELAGSNHRLVGNVRAAAALFMSRDARAARLLATEKETFRDWEARATQLHFERLRSGDSGLAEASALHLEILRDLKRVNAHLVAAAAYPVLESNGELLSSRVRSEEGASE